MEHHVVRHASMPAPLGGYSQVVRAGDLLFVSGQVGIDPETGEPVEGGFEAEARQAFTNLRTILEAAGGGLGHVVKTTMFLTSVDDFASAGRLYAEFFPEDPPARSAPVVALPRGLQFSIEAIAVVA